MAQTPEGVGQPARVQAAMSGDHVQMLFDAVSELHAHLVYLDWSFGCGCQEEPDQPPGDLQACYEKVRAALRAGAAEWLDAKLRPGVSVQLAMKIRHAEKAPRWSDPREALDMMCDEFRQTRDELRALIDVHGLPTADTKPQTPAPKEPPGGTTAAADPGAAEYGDTKPPALPADVEAIDEHDVAILAFLNQSPSLRRKVSEVQPKKGPKDRKAVAKRLRKLADRTPPLVDYPKGGRSGVVILQAGVEALKRANPPTPH